MNFYFDCNSLSVVYLITWKVWILGKVCKKQDPSSTITEFRAWFNQYKSNLKLHDEGRRGFFQEKLIDYFFRQAIMVHRRS